MAATALVISASKLTEFAGEYGVYAAKLTATTATDGFLDLSSIFDSIEAVQCTPAAMTTADYVGEAVASIGGAVITLNGVNSAGTICTQNPGSFYITVVGHKV
ncbi:MAG: hypothetical protein KGL39_32525 [Patescibacteria group bacterium]|nr:hypothetical protein [Patescibacteria group bacterium]